MDRTISVIAAIVAVAIMFAAVGTFSPQTFEPTSTSTPMPTFVVTATPTPTTIPTSTATPASIVTPTPSIEKQPSAFYSVGFTKLSNGTIQFYTLLVDSARHGIEGKTVYITSVTDNTKIYGSTVTGANGEVFFNFESNDFGTIHALFYGDSEYLAAVSDSAANVNLP